MQLIKRQDIPVLKNSGVVSEQLVFPESAPDAKATLTRVTIPVGATSPRHVHETSEQTWVVLSGQGTLLLANATEAHIDEGDVARFEPGDVHGLLNSGDKPFVHLSVTTPPVNFTNAYAKDWQTGFIAKRE
jgi:quercetin dioxygenase-like cupin family protein